MKTSFKKFTALLLIALILCLGACSDNTASFTGVVEVPVDDFTSEFVFGENGLIEKEKKYYDNKEKQYEYYECYEYNENSQIIKRYATDLEGNILEKHDFFEMSYNENGDIKKITNKELLYNFIYNDDGSLKGYAKYEGTQIVSAVYYEYDENGSCIKEIYETADKKISDTTVYTYNENGAVLSSTTKNSSGNAVSEKSFEYNADGLVTKLIKEKNREIRTTEYEYENGVLVKEKMTITPNDASADPRLREYVTTYEYFGNGKVVKFSRARDGEVYITDAYSADEAKGNFADFENIITL